MAPCTESDGIIVGYLCFNLQKCLTSVHGSMINRPVLACQGKYERRRASLPGCGGVTSLSLKFRLWSSLPRSVPNGAKIAMPSPPHQTDMVGNPNLAMKVFHVYSPWNKFRPSGA